MSTAAARAIAIAIALLAGVLALLHRLRSRLPARADIVDPDHSTAITASGAVRSVQAADVTLPEQALDRIWTPAYLERLGRTYWRFLSRVTLGLVRVVYREDERAIVLIARPLALLRFCAPDYEIEAGHGLVRWRIRDGLLVARRGRGGDGHLQIDVYRRPGRAPGEVVAHVRIEVANFYPSLASRLGDWFYSATQSRIHVLVTHGFLRSLARVELAQSRVGRLAAMDFDPRIAGDGG